MTSVGSRCASAMFERLEHELGAQVRRHRPADDAAAPDIEHDGQVEEARPGRDVGDVGHPELVRAVGREVPIDQIGRGLRCRGRGVVVARFLRRLTPCNPAARISRATRLRPTWIPSSREIGVDPRRTVGAPRTADGSPESASISAASCSRACRRPSIATRSTRWWRHPALGTSWPPDTSAWCALTNSKTLAGSSRSPERTRPRLLPGSLASA